MMKPGQQKAPEAQGPPSKQIGQGASPNKMDQGKVPQKPLIGQGPQKPIGQGGPQKPMGQGGPQNQNNQGGPQKPMGPGGPQNQMGQGGPQNQMGQGGPQKPMGQGGPQNQNNQGGPQKQIGQGPHNQNMGQGGPTKQNMGQGGPPRQNIGQGGPPRQNMGQGGPPRQNIGQGGSDGPPKQMGQGPRGPNQGPNRVIDRRPGRGPQDRRGGPGGDRGGFGEEGQGMRDGQEPRGGAGPRDGSGPRRSGPGGMYSMKQEQMRYQQFSGPTHTLPPKEGEEIKKFTSRSRLFVGNLSHEVDEEEFKKLFETYGEVSEVYINKQKGFGFIKMDTRANAETARTTLDNTVLKGHTLKVRFAASGTALRVKNLSNMVSNELLEYAFSMFGEIDRAVVCVDERGRPTGEGIVEFARKNKAVLAYKRCTDECFMITNSPRPVIVEPFEQRDEDDGLPDRLLPSHSQQFMKERDVGPRLAMPNSFEFEFGQRWKQLFELEKQKREQLEREIREDRERLEEQMEFSIYEQETNLLREKLRQREEDANALIREREMRMQQQERMRQQQQLRQEEIMRQRQESLGVGSGMSGNAGGNRQGGGGGAGGEDMRRRQDDNYMMQDSMGGGGGGGGGGVGGGMGGNVGGNRQGGGNAAGGEDMRRRQEDNLMMQASQLNTLLEQQEATMRNIQGGNPVNPALGGAADTPNDLNGPANVKGNDVGRNGGGMGASGPGAAPQRQARFDQPNQGPIGSGPTGPQGPGSMNRGGGMGGPGLLGAGGPGLLGQGGIGGNAGLNERGGMGRKMDYRDQRDDYPNDMKRRRY